MTTKFGIGDKIFNVNYLTFLGNKNKWLQINMQPFSVVAGTGKCTAYLQQQECFSPFFADLRQAAQAPFNHDKIFSQINGLDIDRQTNQFLHTKKDRVEIEALVNKSVNERVKEKRKHVSDRIAKLEREIADLREQEESYVQFCNQCKDDILTQC